MLSTTALQMAAEKSFCKCATSFTGQLGRDSYTRKPKFSQYLYPAQMATKPFTCAISGTKFLSWLLHYANSRMLALEHASRSMAGAPPFIWVAIVRELAWLRLPQITSFGTF